MSGGTFIYLFIFVFIYSFIYLFIHLFIYLFIYLCIYVFMYLCIYVFMYVCIYLFIYLFIYLCIYVFMYVCMYLFICLFIYLYFYLYIYLCIYLFIFKMYVLNRLETNCGKSMIPFHAIWGLCWYIYICFFRSVCSHVLMPCLHCCRGRITRLGSGGTASWRGTEGAFKKHVGWEVNNRDH